MALAAMFVIFVSASKVQTKHNRTAFLLYHLPDSRARILLVVLMSSDYSVAPFSLWMHVLFQAMCLLCRISPVDVILEPCWVPFPQMLWDQLTVCQAKKGI